MSFWCDVFCRQLPRVGERLEREGRRPKRGDLAPDTGQATLGRVALSRLGGGAVSDLGKDRTPRRAGGDV
jgi:hypothetical protein